LLATGSIAFASDENVLGTDTSPGDFEILPLPQTVTFTFPGPLDGWQIDLYIANGAPVDVDAIVLDGSPVDPYPILWDSYGTFGGPAILDTITGEDTHVLTATFIGFEPGETVYFLTMDPDYDGGDPGVPISGLAGVECQVFAGSYWGEGVFEIVGNDVVAVVELDIITPTVGSTWSTLKGLY